MENDTNLVLLESALRLIRDTCSNQSNCTTCPLRAYNVEKKHGLERCTLRAKQPDTWILASDNPNNVYPRIFI